MTSKYLGVAAMPVTNVFVDVLTIFRVADLWVSCSDAEALSLDTTVSIPVEFGKGELNSGIVRALLD